MLRREDWKTWPEEKTSKQEVGGDYFISGDHQPILASTSFLKDISDVMNLLLCTCLTC